MAYPQLDHANHAGITFTRVGDELRAAVTVESGMDGEPGVGLPAGGTIGQVPKKQSATDYDIIWENETADVLEAVDGGAGFRLVSGAVVLDLTNARVFHQLIVGHITGFEFTNVPNANTTSAVWRWVLHVDANGPYILSNAPAVTWVDGSDWPDLDLSANAKNEVMFWTEGAETKAALITNGRLRLDPYVLSFPAAGSHLLHIARAETLVLPDEGVTEAGAAGDTLTYAQNGSTVAAGTVAFVAGDRLKVTVASFTALSSVSIARSVP